MYCVRLYKLPLWPTLVSGTENSHSLSYCAWDRLRARDNNSCMIGLGQEKNAVVCEALLLLGVRPTLRQRTIVISECPFAKNSVS